MRRRDFVALGKVQGNALKVKMTLTAENAD
jgi:hypothetical protein